MFYSTGEIDGTNAYMNCPKVCLYLFVFDVPSIRQNIPSVRKGLPLHHRVRVEGSFGFQI